MRHAAMRVSGLLLCVLSIGASEGALQAAGGAAPSLQEQGDALMRNVEDMVAHGGMGDAKAIVHHCHEAAQYAETLLAAVPEADPRRLAAALPLNRVIEQCRRVADLGVHADPGSLLNPAIKARAAALESIKLLGLAKPPRN